MTTEDKIALFLHIPKTAGSTLRSILDNQYPLQEKMDYYYGDYNEFINKANNNPNLKCINGHFRFGIHKRIQKPSCYVTMLREPIDRVISTYYFIRRNPDHPQYPMIKSMSIEEFVSSKEGTLNFLVSNMQTTYVTGGPLPNLEVAKKNLQQYFDIVGITEMFDQSLFLMSKAFDWKNIEYKRLNVTRNRPKLNKHSDEVINLIREKNQMDLQLYEFGKNLLNKKIESLDHATRAEMDKFLGDIKR